MEKRLHKLFKGVDELNPKARMASFIFSRIENERIKKIKRRLIISYLGIVGSGLLAIYATISYGQNFLHSEFWTMFSLLFSDLTIIIKNWNSFGFSLMETFPMVSSVVLLFSVFMLLISINFYFKNKFSLIHKYNY